MSMIKTEDGKQTPVGAISRRPSFPREPRCYDAPIAELKKLLVDAKKNRLDNDPHEVDEAWRGFIQGIEMAIYRLEMHSAA